MRFDEKAMKGLDSTPHLCAASRSARGAHRASESATLHLPSAQTLQLNAPGELAHRRDRIRVHGSVKGKPTQRMRWVSDEQECLSERTWHFMPIHRERREQISAKTAWSSCRVHATLP